MGYRELTEKDLSIEEKKVFGRIIDMWAAAPRSILIPTAPKPTL